MNDTKDEKEYMTIPIDSILIENRQRQNIGDIEMMAFSIEQFGQFVPIIVQEIGDGKYRLIAGECRIRACQHNGMKLIKAMVYENLTPVEQKRLELEENIRRESLSPIDEARAIREIYKAEQEAYLHHLPGRFGRGFTQKDLAKKLNKSESTISQSLKMAEAADIDPGLELLDSKRDIQKRMREYSGTSIVGSRMSRIAEESMFVEDPMQFFNKQQKETLDLVIMDVDTVQSELYDMLYKKLKMGGSLIIFCPIIKIAQLTSQLIRADFFVTEEPYIWNCAKEGIYKSFIWAGKNREKPLRYLTPHMTYIRSNDVNHSKAKPYQLMQTLIKANTEGKSTVAVVPCFDFESVKAAIDSKRNIKAVFENQTLRDICLLNAERQEN